ncbi:hypothetical protein MAR_006278 [Mya arenaria]|uniref:C1q domain-containing protein n=2 Tax=Mya arenaria TaxID=6604 RepID=A0ABY7D820_MYAAR|nr:hypothetical protein MAR_006278 [Mya arenaria]
MIRMEIEHEKWEKRINETMGKIEKQRNSIHTDLEVLRNEREEFDKHVNETLIDMMQQLSTSKNIKVLFRAWEVSDYTLSTANDKIIFTDVLENVSGGYSSATGEFTAPVAGTYLFSVSLCAVTKKTYSTTLWPKKT